MGTKSKRKNKKIEVTPRKLTEIKHDIAGQTMILTLGYLMDDLEYDPDKLIEVWNGLSRYAEAIDTHLITLNKVCDIINENTGLSIRWNR